MKNQALISSQGKSKKLKCCLLQFLYGALRVHHEFEHLLPINTAIVGGRIVSSVRLIKMQSDMYIYSLHVPSHNYLPELRCKNKP